MAKTEVSVQKPVKKKQPLKIIAAIEGFANSKEFLLHLINREIEKTLSKTGIISSKKDK